ncbi:hypothetical protein M948_12305 [Virgibacillus sp. CM-4]|nr:hypothetical protein M948_12305 [Virgibacillus sp. CM-4]
MLPLAIEPRGFPLLGGDMLDAIKTILNAYSVQPFYIEHETGHLFRIQDGHQQYALKQSDLSEQTVSMWEKVFREAYAENLYTILPVYLTTEGNIYKKHHDRIYYLTPWRGKALTNFNESSIRDVFQSLGTIHAKTKRVRNIPNETFIDRFTNYQKETEERQKKLLHFVENYEKNHYMSPFELLVCTQYRDIDFALKESMRRIDQLLYEQKEDEAWNYSLCHGNLQASHILSSPDQIFFINWEDAMYEYPSLDLSIFFKNETSMYDAPTNLFIQAFDSYMNENELSKKELYMLAIQLLDCQPYLQLLEAHGNSKETMIEQIVSLQHVFRRILFGLQLSAYIEQEYDSFDIDDLES